MSNQMRNLYGQNSLITDYIVPGLSVDPFYFQAPLLTTLTPSAPGLPIVYPGEALAYDPTTKLLMPLRATYLAPDWTPNGLFAGFAMQSAYEGQLEIIVIVQGALKITSLDLSHVSETPPEVFTMSELVLLPNVKAEILAPWVAGSEKVLSLLAVGAPQ